MSTYTAAGSYESWAPNVDKDTFLNEAVAGDGTPLALIALNATTGYSPLVPANPSIDNIPMLHPEKKTEEVRQTGDGLGVGEVYDLGYTDGAGTKVAKCIFGLHIPSTQGNLTAAGITGNVAEIFTITTVADVSKSLNSTYFEFDGVDADGNNPIVKYYVWLDVDNTGADPNAGAGRTAVEVDISENDTAATIATEIKNAIDALDDFGASVADTVVTVTNGTAGAVDDAHDVDTGFTLEVTTDGVSTKTIAESTTLPNIGFHNEKEASGENIRADILGMTQIAYTWSCEDGGMLEEEREYLTAWWISGSDLARPRGPDGLAWESGHHPFSRYKNNFQWGNLTFTFQYNSVDIECKITSVSIKSSIDLDYKRDGGSSYSNGRELKKRDYEITMKVRPTGTDLRDISLTNYRDYTGDITLTVKAKRGDDDNDYIQWAFTKLRLLPIPQEIIVGGRYEEFDIILHAAPENVTTVIVKGYLSQQYYGVD